jgi:hypothetical protein
MFLFSRPSDVQYPIRKRMIGTISFDSHTFSFK